ncbi:MAG TPA: dephospho-CoA kinase, partial [Sneathiellales bacterium]|nr:dephospho-CoA kinase [Sneathiellales bacterium]
DAEKRARADFIIETDRGLMDAARQVAAIVAQLTGHEATSDRQDL